MTNRIEPFACSTTTSLRRCRTARHRCAVEPFACSFTRRSSRRATISLTRGDKNRLQSTRSSFFLIHVRYVAEPDTARQPRPVRFSTTSVGRQWTEPGSVVPRHVVIVVTSSFNCSCEVSMDNGAAVTPRRVVVHLRWYDGAARRQSRLKREAINEWRSRVKRTSKVT